MEERSHHIPNGPGDIRIRVGIEGLEEIEKKLDPRILAIKKRQEQIAKDSEIRQEDLELEFIM